MSVTLSCGHREDDFDKHFPVIVKGYSRDWHPCLEYRVVCEPCKQNYADLDMLTTEEDGMKWMTAISPAVDTNKTKEEE